MSAPYFTLVREMKDAYNHGLRLVHSARQIDIPHYWLQAQTFDLPAVQYTARDVRSGLLFWAFALRRSAAASAVFAARIPERSASVQNAGISSACRVES